MWKGSDMDPSNPEGGGMSSENNPPTQELIDLKDQYEQQQVLISQLKEMLRKSEQTTVTPEKVEEYANTLNRIRAKAKQGKLKKSGNESKEENVTALESRRPSTVNVQTKEKILLLRQKLEENKAKLAKRDKDHKGLEELVTQLKAQLDDSQQFINQTPLNISLNEPKIEDFSLNSSSEELYNALLLKEKRNVELNNKVTKLEMTIIDLQDSLKEKDSVIDARTKAITLMSENMSKKNKLTVDELEDTKEHMKKMQENFVSLEMQLNIQKQSLLKQLKEKNSEIEEWQLKYKNLEDENKNQDISNTEENKVYKKDENKKLMSGLLEMEKAKQEIDNLKIQIEEETNKNHILGEKLVELEKQIVNEKAQNEGHLKKISELESNLNLDDKNENKRYSETSSNNEEIENLRKQLAEYNKNMIKVKAQHKSKLKELNKKLEEFKKISDVNAELVKLKDENLKLKQQILENENQKTETNKMDKDTNTETDDMISSLKEEITNYKLEIASLKDQLENLSVLENAQVTSEINSIHLEERIDLLESQIKKLEDEKEQMCEENLNLLEKIEDLKKEKQEVSTRLDQCLQENLDLIDKLDKLSAEKVSSAESIEIVEGLTQQEKIELEAYQNRLETLGENVDKVDQLEQTIELNESVNQLSEETSDLLSKIELFNEERREVMEKMENLTSENNQLQLKLKEIENNRDILAETYEQLQNEKEQLDKKLQETENQNKNLKTELEELKNQVEIKHGNVVEETVKLESVTPLNASEDLNKKLQEEIKEYKSLVEIQKQEIRDLKVHLLSSNTSDDLKQELANLEVQYEKLLSENQKLKEAVKSNSELVHEKDAIEGQLREAKNQIFELETQIKNALDEINEYKIELEQKTEALDSSNNLITQLQNQIEEQQESLVSNETTIEHLNNVVVDLTNKSSELQTLKDSFEKDLHQIKDYQNELSRNSEIISNLEDELKRLNLKILETEHLLESKDDEIETLKKEVENRNNIIENLRQELKVKDEQFHKMCDQLRERCVAMQSQIELNEGSMKDIRGPLEDKIHELETKNKEQLEKMKKLAANLKKKSLQCQELENKITQLTKNTENEDEIQKKLKEKDDKISEYENEIKKLLVEIDEISSKLKINEVTEDELKKLQVENDQLKSQINQYIAINNDLQNIKTSYEAQINAFSDEMEIMRSNIHNSMNTEITRKDEIINSLNERYESLKYNSETSLNAAQVKIQELESFIETQEAELSNYKTKANKLEEGLSIVEERRASLERKAIELGAELEEKSHNYEEISQTEDILEQRLSALLIHDEIIEKRLQETNNENQELIERNRLIMEDNARLKEELNSASGKIVDVSDFLERISFLENENAKLTEHSANIENDFKRLQMDLNKKLMDKERDLDILESELNNEIEINSSERKHLLVQCEQLHDQLKKSRENQDLLQEEINNYESKIKSLKNDLQNTTAELNQVKLSNEKNVGLVSELQEKLKNNSNTSVVENLQPQAVQNDQNQTLFQNDVSSISSYFGNVSQDLFSTEINKNDQEVEDLKQKLLSSQTEIENLNQEKIRLENKIFEMETQICDLNNQIEIIKHSQAQKMSENIVEEVILNAKEQLVQSANTAPEKIGNINWDNVNKDPIEVNVDLQSLEQENKIPENVITSDLNELQNKVKTLEFMLYNAEKEKEEALQQCNQLTNELAQLIYEKEERKVAHNDPNTRSLEHFESQIVQPGDLKISEQDRHQLHKIEFGKVDFTETDSSQPVEEIVSPPKDAYLEYKANDNQQRTEQSISGDLFDNDDGWGWGPEEAKMEEIHFKNISSSVQIDSSTRINQLEERIRVLELDRERHLEEIRQSQIKAGKLIKKLKDLKNQNDKLTSQKVKTDGLDDLENAIQEELKLQIANLEKTIKEISGELDKERREKSNLLKRIDVLTASHEKMLEMKEKQDIEMIGWQQKNRELVAKLEQFEWGDGGNESPKIEVSQQQISTGENNNNETLLKQIDELNETIKELTLDNEELQALLEDQRNIRINLERSKSLEPSLVNMKSEEEYSQVLAEKNKLKESLVELEKENLIKKELEKKVNDLEKHEKELEVKLQENNQILSELQNTNQNLILQVYNVENENAKLVSELNLLNSLKEKFEMPNLSSEELKIKIDSITKEKSDLFEALQESNVQIQNLNDMLSESTKQVLTLENNLAESKEKQQILEQEMQELLLEVDKHKTLSNELSNKTKQIENELSLKNEEFNTIQNELKITLQDLQEQLKQKDQISSKLEADLRDQSVQLENLQSDLKDKNQQLEALLTQLKDKDSEFEHKLTVTVEQLTQEWSQRVDQRGADVAESWKMHVEARESEFSQLEQQLRKEIFELESKFNVLVNENNDLRKNVDAEIRNEVDRVSALQQQIFNSQEAIKQLEVALDSKQKEIDVLQEEIKSRNNSFEIIKTQLEEKCNEYAVLHELVKEKDILLNEKQTICNNLQEELNEIKKCYNDCQNQLDVEKEARISAERLNTDNQNLIQSISQKLHETTTQLENANKTIFALENQVKGCEERISDLLRQIHEKELQLNQYSEHDSHLETLSVELRNKDSVINQMQALLQEKEREFSYTLESKINENESKLVDAVRQISSLKQMIEETETHYQEILMAKEADAQKLQAILQEQSLKLDEVVQLKERLTMKQKECDDLERNIEEQKTKLDGYRISNQQLEQQNEELLEENKQIAELHKIIEDQVLRIEEMKQQLFEKSKDYDSIIAEVEMHKIPAPISTSTQKIEPPKEILEKQVEREEGESDKAELDLALYLLHQRDVRCEELTVELVQLLEERDTLQLKLSNALREKEELRNRILKENVETDDKLDEKEISSSTGAIPKSKTSEIVLGATGTELATEEIEHLVKSKDDLLNSKLSELKSVSYRRDKTILDEQEQRRLQDFVLRRQYQEVGAMLPPEAAAKLVQDANYTLSRDVQSPSKVLLNWLWGRSTPKVNDT